MLQCGPALPLEPSVLLSQEGFSVWSRSLSPYVQRRGFFFFLMLFNSSWAVGAAEMCGYRSARVAEVCIEFRSWII